MIDLTQDAAFMAAIDAIDNAPALPEEKAFERMLELCGRVPAVARYARGLRRNYPSMTVNDLSLMVAGYASALEDEGVLGRLRHLIGHLDDEARTDRPGYLLRANVWLGEDPDTPDSMIGLEADVRLAGGRWYADVFGLPLRCDQVFHVVAATDEPFTLPQAWAARVVPDDGGPEHEAIITAWDGTGWVGSAGPIAGMIDNPTPTRPEEG